MWPSAGLTRLELGDPMAPGGLRATAWGGGILVEESKAERVLRTQFKPLRGFPGGTVVENLPANAGDTGSSPGLGRSHMPRSNWSREPQLLSLRVWSLCSATRGLRTAMKSGPPLPQLEKALVQK